VIKKQNISDDARKTKRKLQEREIKERLNRITNKILVMSGKGGGGKSSVVDAFASLAKNKVLCDADVDAADLHLIMASDINECHDFQSGYTAIISQDA
jgi:Mrp family chromosome partitioning ATPase